MRLRFKDLKANPFRDLKVDPVDKAHVAELAKSIRKNGWWGGVTIRRGKDGHEVAGGWHRALGAIEAGLIDEDFSVKPFTDAEMRRIYSWENATQRGNTATAIAGSVATAVRAVLQERLSSREIARTRGGGPTKDGVGQDAILKELPDVPGINEHVVKQQLANLKASGDYDRIVREETAKSEAANAAKLQALRAAEEARAAAQRREQEARERREAAEAARESARREREERQREADREREAAARAAAQQRAREAARREEEAEVRQRAAAKDAALRKAERQAAEKREREHAPAKATRDAIDKARASQKQEVTFDLAGVSRYFRNAAHVETFRRLALKHQQFVPVASQAALAKRLVEAADEREKPHTGHLSMEFIEQEFLGLLSMAKSTKRDMETTARMEALARATWEEKVAGMMERFNGTASGLRKLVADLAQMERSRPRGASVLASARFDSGVRMLRDTLDVIETQLRYRPAEEGEQPVRPGRKALTF